MSARTSRPTVGELAAHVGGELQGDASVVVQGINAIADATADEITFVSRGTYARQWSQSRAAAALVSRSAAAAMPDDDPRPLIIVPDAEIASIQVLEFFAPPPELPDTGIDPKASVHDTAQIADNVRIAAHVSVGAGVILAEGVILYPGVHLYRGVEVGAGSVLHANVVVRERCRIGRGVIIHQNTSIGADGFGYRPDPKGGGLLKVPHIGNVVIEDQVEIGANSCVDRGKFGSTVIGAGTKIDNLCQIGHNTRIGRSCILAGGILVAGSVTIGAGVLIAGGAGIRDHVSIGSGARIGASTIVLKDMPAGATWLGYPADEAGATKRQWASLRKLPGLVADWQRNKPDTDKSD